MVYLNNNGHSEGPTWFNLGSRDKRVWRTRTQWEVENVCSWTILFYLCCPVELDFLTWFCFALENLEVSLEYSFKGDVWAGPPLVKLGSSHWIGFCLQGESSKTTVPHLGWEHNTTWQKIWSEIFDLKGILLCFFLIFSLIVSLQRLVWVLWYSHYSLVAEHHM